jgi:hypothetical protein
MKAEPSATQSAAFGQEGQVNHSLMNSLILSSSTYLI